MGRPPNKPRTAFGRWVRDSGKTHKAIREKLGISQPRMSDLCSGAGRPSIEIAAKIEKLTGGAVGASSW